MKKKKVIAELVDPGECRYYQRGQKFLLDGGFKPAGLCESGYSIVRQAVETLSSYRKLPGSSDGKVLVRCSCHGAVWEVQLEEAVELDCLPDAISDILKETS